MLLLTFVTELPADLVDPLQAADDELLEIQLGGDAHEHVQTQVVVVGYEGLRSSSS